LLQGPALALPVLIGGLPLGLAIDRDTADHRGDPPR
jgi:hypothetical protein